MRESTLGCSPVHAHVRHLGDLGPILIRDLLQRVLEEEVTEFLGHALQRRSAVDATPGSRNGHGTRPVSLMSGTIEVRRPRVRGLEGASESRICRCSARTHEVTRMLPELYLHGLSQGDFELALRGLLGNGAPLSSSSIGRLRAQWDRSWRPGEATSRPANWCTRGRMAYVKAGLEKDKAALLVVIGAMSDGRLPTAVWPGHRESTESWLKVLRDLRDRGLRAPLLLMADGGLPIWSATEQVWPQASHQRCWNHKILNVLDDLPKRVQGKARALLTQFPSAETRQEAEKRVPRLPAATATGSAGGSHPRTRGSAWSPSTPFGALETPVAQPTRSRAPLLRYA